MSFTPTPNENGSDWLKLSLPRMWTECKQKCMWTECNVIALKPLFTVMLCVSSCTARQTGFELCRFVPIKLPFWEAFISPLKIKIKYPILSN